MSPINVGLIGHNGLVGASVLKQLSTLQTAGKIHLVVLHRAGSSTSTIPAEAEKRVVDLKAADGEAFDEAVKSLDVLISAIASEGNADQAALLPALSRSKTLKTFFPSEYGAPWSEEELKIITTQFLKDKEVVAAKAKELGIPLTIVKTGLLTDFVFNFPLAQWNPKANQIQIWRESQKATLPFTSSGYIAAAIANLIQRPLDSIANKTFAAIELESSDKEIASILTKLHGRETEWTQTDDETIQAGVTNAHPIVSLSTGIFQKSGKGWWNYEGLERVEVEGWEGKGLAYEIEQGIARQS